MSKPQTPCSYSSCWPCHSQPSPLSVLSTCSIGSLWPSLHSSPCSCYCQPALSTPPSTSAWATCTPSVIAHFLLLSGETHSSSQWRKKRWRSEGILLWMAHEWGRLTVHMLITGRRCMPRWLRSCTLTSSTTSICRLPTGVSSWTRLLMNYLLR